MKIALAPDLHCFYQTYAASGVAFREDEWDRCADALFKASVDAKAEVLVAPGDFFTNPRPTAGQVLKVAKLFQHFESAGIKVVGINGNHDVGSIGSKSMNDVVDSIGDTSRWCSSECTTVVIGDVGFALLPYMKNAQVVAYNPEYATMEVADGLLDVSKKLFDELEGKARRRILVGHWSISGAGLSSSGLSTENTNEVVLDREELVRQGWDACLFGHIHKPQVLQLKPFVAYSGAMQRVSLAEAKDERKFFIYDTEAQTYEEFPLPAIEMLSISVDVAQEDDIEKLFDAVKNADAEGKIVQIKYTVVKPLAASIKKKELIALLSERNPLKIAGVVPKVVDPSVQQLDFAESVDNATALRKWAEIKGYDKAMQDKLVGLMAKYDAEEVP